MLIDGLALVFHLLGMMAEMVLEPLPLVVLKLGVLPPLREELGLRCRLLELLLGCREKFLCCLLPGCVALLLGGSVFSIMGLFRLSELLGVRRSKRA